MKLRNIAKTSIFLGLVLAMSGCGVGSQLRPINEQTNAQVAISSSPTPPAQQKYTVSYKNFQWIGLESKINNKFYQKPDGTNSYKPDGVPDGHFRVTLDLSEPIVISNISLTNSEFGKKVKWDWSPYGSSPLNYIMSIYDNEQTEPGLKEHKISGLHTLDIYVKGLEEFSFDGKEFSLDILYLTKESEYADHNLNAKIKI